MKAFFKKVGTTILMYLSVLTLPFIGLILIVSLSSLGEQSYSPCSGGKVLFTTKNRDNIIVTCQDDKEISHVWDEVWTKGLFKWVKKKSVQIDPD